MPNNNPTGANGVQMFDGFNAETAYGAVKRLTQLTQAAPVAKPAKRKPQAQQPVPVEPPQAAIELTPQAAWLAVAQIPGISPLVTEWAAGA